MAGYQSMPEGWVPPFWVLQAPKESPAWLHHQGPLHGGYRGVASGGPQHLSNFAHQRSPLEAMERLRMVLLDVYPRQEGQGARRATSHGQGLGVPRARQEPRRLWLDMSGFSAEELSVKLEGRRLSVVGQRGQSLQLRREVMLPRDTDLEAVACSLGPDGRLWVEVPRLALPSPTQHQERHVPIALSRTDEANGGEHK
ncbi:heat shock protein beta-11-like [Sceloporus undulatus]|uniref:heat shock protein beta-11-like n=1 Tax=Sceloporus undulatus TaxID=8520 RepID=UPI001C4ABDA8|nr:heat shock protein beta-11-like [Sceloporus undulatus]